MNLSPLAWLIIYISVGSVLGIALGHIKYKGVGIGIGGVLFSGILVGHFAHAYNGFDLATETWQRLQQKKFSTSFRNSV